MKILLFALIFLFINSASNANDMPRFENQTEYKKAELKFYNIFFEGYAKETKDPKEVQDLVKELYFSFVPTIIFSEFEDNKAGKKEQIRIKHLWEQLKTKKSVDPFTQSVYLDISKYYKIGDYHPFKHNLAQGYKKALKSDNSLLKGWIQLAYFRHNSNVQNNSLKTAERKEIINQLVDYLNELTLNNPDHSRFVYNLIRKDLNEFGIFNNELSYFLSRIINHKTTHPWIKAMASVNQQYSLYRKNRNNPEGKKYFAKYIEFLRKTGEMFPQNPEPFASLSARAPISERDEMFQKAVDAQFDYLPAYERYQKYPNLDFCLKCYKSLRFDTDVPMYLHYYYVTLNHMDEIDKRVYTMLMNLYSQKARNSNTGYLANKVITAFSRNKNNYLSLKLALAVKFVRLKDVKSILKEIEKENAEIDIRTFTEFGLNVDFAISYAYALSGNAGKIVSAINKEIYKMHTDLKKIASLKRDVSEAKEITNENEAEAYFKFCERKIKNIENYLSSKWLNFEFTKSLPDYKEYGTWHYESPSSVKASTQGTMTRLIFENAEIFNLPYEMEVQIEELTVKRNGNRFRTGISFFTKGNNTWAISFWINPKRKEAGVTRVGYRKNTRENPDDVTVIKVDKKKSNTLRVKAWDQYYEVYLNDKMIYKAHDEKFSPTAFLIGADVNNISYFGSARFSNWRIKKNIEEKPSAK